MFGLAFFKAEVRVRKGCGVGEGGLVAGGENRWNEHFSIDRSYGHQTDWIILSGCRGPIRGGACKRLEVHVISLWGAKRDRLFVAYDDTGRALRSGFHGDTD
jgi:hypothetical protein